MASKIDFVIFEKMENQFGGNDGKGFRV